MSELLERVICSLRGHDWSEWYWRGDRYGLQRMCTRCDDRQNVSPASLRLPRGDRGGGTDA
jgi:hypothetical protein